MSFDRLRSARGPSTVRFTANVARRAVPLLAVLSLFAPTGAGAQVLVDDFTSATPQSTNTNSEVAATVFGGYRDVKSNNTSNVASANAGRFTCSGTAAFQGCTVQYDGHDMDAVTFTPGNITPTDFTAGGHDRFVISTFVASGTCNLLVEVCDNEIVPVCGTRSTANISNNGKVTYLFSDFSPTTNFSQVTAMFVNLTPISAPVDCSVGVVKTSPLFADGFESGNTSAWSAAVS